MGNHGKRRAGYPLFQHKFERLPQPDVLQMVTSVYRPNALPLPPGNHNLFKLRIPSVLYLYCCHSRNDYGWEGCCSGLLQGRQHGAPTPSVYVRRRVSKLTVVWGSAHRKNISQHYLQNVTI